jgi:dolichol-phosphate mannosyltransferase
MALGDDTPQTVPHLPHGVALLASRAVSVKDANAGARSPLTLLRIPDPRRVPRDDWMQLVRFLAVGASGYVVNLAIFSIALLLGLHYIPAAVVAFVIAWVNNFLLNRYWTFRARDEAMVGQGARYLLVSLVALGANLLILQLLVEAGLGETLSQAIAIALVTPLSYLLSRRWSFR